jgi:hypothetical protein
MTVLGRVTRAWRALAADQRMAAYAAIALFVTMFLPWYSKSAIGVNARGLPVKVDDDLNAFQAFSFVEAAVLLVAAGVLFLLFQRAENRGFHLPGGDGMVVLAAGVWVCLLVFYRQLDKPDAGEVRGIATTVGVQWGIFVTFLAGLGLAAAGQRVRAAHHAEPPLPVDTAPTQRVAARPRPPAADGGDQLSFDDQSSNKA